MGDLIRSPIINNFKNKVEAGEVSLDVLLFRHARCSSPKYVSRYLCALSGNPEGKRYGENAQRKPAQLYSTSGY